jgi:type IV secretory pathway VirB2 component (pilin)
MNPLRHIRRAVGALAGLATALLALAAFAPAAFASGQPPVPLAGNGKHQVLPPGHVAGPVLSPGHTWYPPAPHVHTVVVGGMPGWQIALIAIGAALAAATAAVLFDHARSGRRRPASTAA